jgi:hypothetical protein
MHTRSRPGPSRGLLSLLPSSLALPSSLLRYGPILGRLVVTVGMLTVIRLGFFIPVPGLDLTQLPAATHGMEGGCAWRDHSSPSAASGLHSAVPPALLWVA